jgi:fructosamine-3-kinase
VNELAERLSAALDARVISIEAVGDGTYGIVLDTHYHMFVKSRPGAPAGMYAAEASGLAWLRDGARTAPFPRMAVPEVYCSDDDWLALQWVDVSRPDPAAFGRALAGLHRAGAPTFGLDANNFLATLPQDNTPEPDWPTFYVERRLRPLCRRAGLHVDAELDRLRARPEVFGPPEPPARLHGDLWWGNVGHVRGTPAVFDPAVYGGHRDVDLAMLALFGGVPDALLAAYDEVFPLAEGWRERVALYQLYPLAAHACLFGGSYAGQVTRLLARYV